MRPQGAFRNLNAIGNNQNNTTVITFTKIFSLLGCSLLCLVLWTLTPSSALAQEQQQAAPNREVVAKDAPTGNTSVREEIQRYLGYEKLPARYLSLPYDATMNPTVRGPLVDISPVFLLFIPILFLLGYWKRPLAGSLFMLFCLLILCISVANSLVFSYEPPFELDKTDLIANYVSSHSFADAPLVWMDAQLHLFFRSLYRPLDALFSSISGDADFITYPLLLLLFIGGFFALRNRIQLYDLKTKTIFIFTYVFSFLWLLLTAGIIWYGYLAVALGILFAIYPLSQKTSADKALVGIRYGLWAVLGFVFIMLLNYKLMRYRPAVAERPQENKSFLFDASMLQYQLGSINQTQVLDNMYLGGGVTDVLKKINSEEQSKVYRVGTIFPFFIKKSHTRVLLDNQLGIFQGIANEFKNQATITEVLKASGYKYLLVDLATPNIDKTPEKTLITKFEILMRFLYQNPSVQLLTTDRGVIVEGQNQMVRKVFPDLEANERIGHYGSFAIYEIK